MTDAENARKRIPANVEAPVGASQAGALFGSDLIADTLRALDLPYIALNPGASYRGLHDSIVNYLGNESPRMLLCLHEEHAVAIAHGYAKVTDKPMAVAVHSNVGLMHATMAIFNAWCDRAPMLILGATGAVDAARRRPWIEWIHTARDQAALVRDYVKWDDQPASLAAARESILRGAWLTGTAPKAPVYIVLGLEMQEDPAAGALPPILQSRYMPALRTSGDVQDVGSARDLLRNASHPLILAGRVSRDPGAWRDRVELAERLGAPVVTDNRVACSFPTDHPLHLGVFRSGLFYVTESVREAVERADVILSLDWLDLAGSMKMVLGEAETAAKVVQVSMDHQLHNGWSFDYMGLPAVDLMIAAEPDALVAQLLTGLEPRAEAPNGHVAPLPSPELVGEPITLTQVASALRQVTEGREVSLLQLPASWNAKAWHFTHPLDYLGMDGGGGIGSGPGLAAGAALALRGSGRLPIAIIGDGNFMMGCSAVWTAVHYRIPVLIIVTNNQSFYNDEIHQEWTARRRERPVENKWIGMRMADPEIDIATVARGQGAVGLGPVYSASGLLEVLGQAVAELVAGRTVVVDVRIKPGYDQ